jgi:hypothetical protein
MLRFLLEENVEQQRYRDCKFAYDREAKALVIIDKTFGTISFPDKLINQAFWDSGEGNGLVPLDYKQ